MFFMSYSKHVLFIRTQQQAMEENPIMAMRRSAMTKMLVNKVAMIIVMKALAYHLLTGDEELKAHNYEVVRLDDLN